MTYRRGEFSIPVDFGQYKIFAHGNGQNCGGNPNYAREYWQEQSAWADATIVELTPEQPTADGIRFTLAVGGSIAGHVYADDGITPLADVCVHVSSTAPDWNLIQGWYRTDADGAYLLPGLPVGNVYVRTDANCNGAHPDVEDKWYAANGGTPDGTQAQTVGVISGQTATGIDFSLGAPGAIFGHILDANGNVITDAQISVHAHPLSQAGSSLGAWVSQSDGSYTIEGVAPGDYIVEANNNHVVNYVSKYYVDTQIWDEATIVTVEAGVSTGPIDFALNPITTDVVFYEPFDYTNGPPPPTITTYQSGGSVNELAVLNGKLQATVDSAYMGDYADVHWRPTNVTFGKSDRVTVEFEGYERADDHEGNNDGLVRIVPADSPLDQSLAAPELLCLVQWRGYTRCKGHDATGADTMITDLMYDVSDGLHQYRLELNHVDGTDQAGAFRFYRDGILEASSDDVSSFLADTNTVAFRFQGGDTVGAIYTWDDVRITVKPTDNPPPSVPSAPFPADSAQAQQTRTGLRWTGGDPNGDPITYDVLLGVAPDGPLMLMCDDITDTLCQPAAKLALDTSYLWQVVASDGTSETAGPVWSFDTNGDPVDVDQHFEDTSFQENWYVTSAAWRSENGELHADGIHADQSDRYRFDAWIDGNWAATDRLEISFRGMLKSAGNPQAGRGIGLAIAADLPAGSEGGHYVVRIENGYTNGPPVNPAISFGMDVGRPNQSIIAPAAPVHDQWYAVKVIREGGTWSLYVDGELVGSHADTLANTRFWRILLGTVGSVAVDDLRISAVPECHLLTLSSDPAGNPPVASPAGSVNCPAGRYAAGEVIDLTATPPTGWRVQGWNGIDDDAVSTGTSQVTMPAADRTVTVTYERDPVVFTCDTNALLCDTFDGNDIDPSRWLYATNGQNSGYSVANGELSIHGGSLIGAGAWVSSVDTVTFDGNERIEMVIRSRVTSGDGAFWGLFGDGFEGIAGFGVNTATGELKTNMRASAAATQTMVALPSIDPSVWHDYRIELEADTARFYVDGELVVSSQENLPVGKAMRVRLDNAAAVAPPQYAIVDHVELQVIDPCAAVNQIPTTECQALVDLYTATDGDNWTTNTDWLQTATPCDWHGVSCTDSRVTVLSLAGNGLTGPIPASLQQLTQLRELRLYENQLTGGIPSALGTLTQLQYLGLHKNPLGGALPPELGGLANLELLLLGENQLTGPIPTSFAGLTALRELYLWGNQLEGPIPLELMTLAGLEVLDLDGNQFTGTIPPELADLPNLIHLDLDMNQLQGPIPATLGTIATLQTLDLAHNELSGTIPAAISDLSSLTQFNVVANALEGEIPPVLANLANLDPARSSFGYNMLTASDATLRVFLAEKDAGWEQTQTVAPVGVTATPLTPESVQLDWTPILYTADGGYYEIGHSTQRGGPYTWVAQTADKGVTSHVVDQLTPDQTIYFAVRTYTPPHAGNQNELWSQPSAEVAINAFEVMSTVPTANQHTADPQPEIRVTYNRSIAPASVTADSLVVHGMQSGQRPDLPTAANDILSLTPGVGFHAGELVNATATNAVASTSGQQPARATVWQFRTGVESGPGVFTNGATLASVDSPGTFALAIGDLNGDGLIDAVTGSNNANEVWLNDGDGALVDSGARPAGLSAGIALGDLDGDGDLDAFIARVSGQPNQVWMNENGILVDRGQRLGSSNSQSVALGDVDGDGDLDAVVGNSDDQANTVWINDGAGDFGATATPLGMSKTRSIALGDLDNDGDLDIYAGNDGQADRVWINDGSGTFTDSGQAVGTEGTRSVTLGDFDGDGDLDVVTGNNASNYVWTNNGAAGFTQAQAMGSGGQVVVAGDVDGDGDLDVLVGTQSRIVLWANDGTAAFTNSQEFSELRTEALVLGDFDNDGDLDLLAGNQGVNAVWYWGSQAHEECNVSITPTRMDVYGNVALDDAPAPVGTVVRALNPRGDTVGCYTVDAAGTYGAMPIYGEDSTATPPIPGMAPGETVTFQVDGKPAAPSTAVTWQNGAAEEVHLAQMTLDEQTLTLTPGWNLVSLWIDPLPSSVRLALGSALDFIDRIMGENGIFVPTLDEAYVSLSDLEGGISYWMRIRSTAAEDVLLQGQRLPVDTSLPLHAGWNWIGYLPDSALPVTTALQSIDGFYQRVLSADEIYIAGLPNFSTLKTMKPGAGYLIYMDQDATLVYPTAPVSAASLPAGTTKTTAGCHRLQPTPAGTLVYGALTVGDAPAPLGTRVEVLTPSGEMAGCFEVTTAGQYGLMHVYGADDTEDPPIPGFVDGEQLRFRVAGTEVDIATLTWSDDKAPHRIDLAAPAPVAMDIYLPVIPNGDATVDIDARQVDASEDREPSSTNRIYLPSIQR